MPTTNRTTRAMPVRRGGAAVKVIIAAVALVGLGVGGIFLSRSLQKGETLPVASLDIASAGPQAFDVSTTSSGELEAKNQIEIRSRLEKQASIVQVVAEGEMVKAGDLLVKLNTDDVEQELEEELLRYETARADLIAAEEAYQIQVNENESALRQAVLKLDLARLSLSQWEEGEVKQKRQDNTLAIEKAERELTRLSEKYERSVELESQGFLSRDQLQQDELALKEAEAALAKALLSARVYEEFEHPKAEKQRRSDVEEAEAELDRVRRQNASRLASKEADLINKRRQLAIREQRVADYREQIELATITAPSAGLVVYASSMQSSRFGWREDGPLQVGQNVNPNEILMVLPDTSEMVAAVRVHETLAGRIRPGQRSTVRIDAKGGRAFQGVVQSVGVLAESGGWRDPNLREYTVRIDLLNDEGESAELKPSMRCEAEIIMDRVDAEVAVPIQAVFNEGMVRYVHVVRGSKLVRRPVMVGRRSSQSAEIRAGLRPGERVLLRAPAPGELMPGDWSDTELAAAGYERAENGEIRMAAGGGRGGPGGPGATARRGGGDGSQPAVVPVSADKPAVAVDAAAEESAEGDAGESDAEGDAGQTEGAGEAQDAKAAAPAAENAPAPAGSGK